MKKETPELTTQTLSDFVLKNKECTRIDVANHFNRTEASIRGFLYTNKTSLKKMKKNLGIPPATRGFAKGSKTAKRAGTNAVKTKKFFKVYAKETSPQKRAHITRRYQKQFPGCLFKNDFAQWQGKTEPKAVKGKKAKNFQKEVSVGVLGKTVKIVGKVPIPKGDHVVQYKDLRIMFKDGMLMLTKSANRKHVSERFMKNIPSAATSLVKTDGTLKATYHNSKLVVLN